MRNLFFSILILLNICAIGQNYNIYGVVVDSITGRPIEFATIIVKIDSNILNGVYSDTLGHFRIQNIKSEKISLIVSATYRYSKKIIEIKLNNKDNEILIKLLSYTDCPPDKYIIYNKDTIYFNSNLNTNDWVLTCIDCPSVKMCDGNPCNGLVRTYFINGQVEEIATFENGIIKNGHLENYYKNGKLERIGEYKDSKRINQWIFYSEQGQIESIANYDESGNVITIYSFSENGIMEDYELNNTEVILRLNFKKNGLIETYFLKSNEIENQYIFDEKENIAK